MLILFRLFQIKAVSLIITPTKTSSRAECYLLQEPWFADQPTCLDAVSHNLALDSWASGGLYFNDISDP
jgi:hypothetical protein